MPIDKISGIVGAGGIRKVDKKKKLDSKRNVDFSSSVSEEELATGLVSGVDGASSSPSAGGVEALDTLLAVQEITQKEQVSEKKLSWGNLLLDDLEDIRVKLLSGRVHRSYLDNLLRDIEKKDREVADEKLEGIINEIEIRARVEMAKLDRLGSGR